MRLRNVIRLVGALVAAALVVAGLTIPAQAADDYTACGVESSPADSFVRNGDQVSIRMGCARDAREYRDLAQSDNDVVAVIDTTSDKQGELQKMFNAMADAHRDGHTLSDYFESQYGLFSPNLFPPSTGADTNFDGSIWITDSSLIVAIPAGQIQANANWWQKLIAFWASAAVTVLTGGTCLAVLAVGAPYAAPVCGAVAGFFGAMTNELINAAFDGRSLGSSDVWAETMSQAISAAVVGAASGGLLTWVNNGVRPLVTNLQVMLRNAVTKLKIVAAPLNAIANLLDGNFAASLQNYLRNSLGTASIPGVRLMPLGDSITAGVESSTGNGYRAELFRAVNYAFRTPDFVGTQSSGTMQDKDHEGHPGWRIDEIATAAGCAVPRMKPNVVTLMAGTNDANQNYDIPNAVARLQNLVSQVLKDSPRAVVVVAQIIPTGKAGLQPRIDTINAGLATLVRNMQTQGKHVVYTHTSDLTTADGLQNDAHPDDAGYDKLGEDFARGVMEARVRGWLQSAEPANPGAACTVPADADGATALGAGWRKLGVIAPGMSRPATYDRIELGDMNGDGRSDYVQIRKDGSIRVGINTPGEPGKPTWPNWLGQDEFLPAGGRAAVPTDPNAASVADQMRLADIDGDGRDDVVFVAADGRMDAYLNISLTPDGPPGWTKMENFGPFKNVNRANIRFADLNGDGRDDLLRVGSTGEVHAYFNGRGDPSVIGANPSWWEKLSWAPGVKGASLNNLRFADVDADRRADYLMVGQDGTVHAYLNKGGKDNGGFEEHKNWANASNYPGNLVQFKDISGDGKADYLVVYAEGAVRAWLNRGGNL